MKTFLGNTPIQTFLSSCNCLRHCLTAASALSPRTSFTTMQFRSVNMKCWFKKKSTNTHDTSVETMKRLIFSNKFFLYRSIFRNIFYKLTRTGICWQRGYLPFLCPPLPNSSKSTYPFLFHSSSNISLIPTLNWRVYVLVITIYFLYKKS